MTETECEESDGSPPEQHSLFWKLRNVGATKEESDSISRHPADFYAMKEVIAFRMGGVSPERVKELYLTLFGDKKSCYKR